jgi:endogenous inhibitor of DNA gyrase (YacG/DUF329 family)
MAAPRKSGYPICHKPSEQRFAPFCSQRCGDVDLGRWFGEAYRVPTSPPELNDDEDGQPNDFEG